MQTALEIFEKIIAIIVVAVALPFIYIALKKFLRKRLLIILPTFLYFFIAAYFIFTSRIFVGIFSIIIGVLTHIILYYTVSFFRDKKIFKSIQINNTFDYIKYYSDPNTVFFKKETKEKINIYVDKHIAVLEAFSRVGNSEFFEYIILLIRNYHLNQFKPIKIHLNFTLSLTELNKFILQVNNKDHYNSLADINNRNIEQKQNSLDHQRKLSHQEKLALRRDIIDLRKEKMINEAFAEASGNSKIITPDDEILIEAVHLMTNATKIIIGRFLPDFMISYVSTAHQSSVDKGIKFRVEPAHFTAVMMWESNRADILTAARLNEAIITPRYKELALTLDIFYNNVNRLRNTTLVESNSLDQYIKGYTQTHYRKMLMVSLLSDFKRCIKNVLGFENLFDSQNKGNENNKNEINFFEKLATDLNNEAKNKGEDGFEAVLSSAAKGSLGLSGAGAALTEEDIKAIFAQNRALLEDFFDQMDRDIAAALDISFGDIVAAIEIPSP